MRRPSPLVRTFSVLRHGVDADARVISCSYRTVVFSVWGIEKADSNVFSPPVRSEINIAEF